MTAGFLVQPGDGESVWSIGGRFTRKVGGDDTADRLAILEAVVTRTSEPRLHIHHREDEAFYVLDGQLSFHVGETVLTAVAGSLAFAPMGIPHTFTVDIEPSRVLVITGPAGFERFVFELGVPATSDEPPAWLAPPPAAVILPVAERHGIEIVGPRIRDMEESPDMTTSRIEVRKTYKLYIGGAFPRTESGRSYLVSAADGTPLANACRASRKDLRDAVRAARKAQPGWADKTAMNRGQVLYRVAELMEGRRDQFVAEVAAGRGGARRDRPASSSTGRSIAGSGTRAGPTRSPRCSGRPTRSRRRTSTSRSPSRPASWASSRPRRRRCSGSSAGSRRRSCRGTPSSSSPRRRGRCRPSR